MSIGPVAGARTMFDSVTAGDIPTTAKMVAGYVDGAYAWSESDWQRHATATQVGITVTGNDTSAAVIDFETGNVDAAGAAAWAKRKHDAGGYPVVYVQESRIGELQAALAAYPAFPVGYWRANWNDSADLYENDIAHQYANPTLTGRHYDLSVVRPYWPGVDPAPQPPSPAPTPNPQPSPAPGPPAPANLDQARAAWARLGELLITDFPGAVDRVAAAITKLLALP